MKSTPVTKEQRAALTAFITARPFLIWYSTAYATMPPECIVEAALNYGDWDDVQQVFGILGKEKVARIFREQTSGKRINYYPQIVHFFHRYFDRYVPRPSYA